MKKIILIPVYNDWKSLNLLIYNIERKIKLYKNLEILILDDASTIKPFIRERKNSKIKTIKILSFKKNVGSQKAISIGLDYLKKKEKNFIVAIMDGDGEDDPANLDQMFDLAIKNKSFIITSHRKKRKENILIRLGYKIHLVLAMVFTWHWISFGNFSALHSKNLNKINLNETLYAYSSSILKNCKIIKVFSSRKKRYYGISKVNLFQLIEHSLRIISVFYKRVLVSSTVIIYLSFLFDKKFVFIFIILILFNFLILFIIFKYKVNKIDYKNYLKLV